jgi:hypothetical protein
MDGKGKSGIRLIHPEPEPVESVKTARLKRDRLFSIPELKERGWTDTAIKRFLPTPDDTRVDPHHKSAPPMKPYLTTRVKRTESTNRFQEWRSGADARSLAASQAVDTKEASLLAFVDDIVIDVPRMTDKELLISAVEHYNAHWSSFENPEASEKRAHITDAPEFLVRIQVNYLRHSQTRYEQHLDEVGKTGAVKGPKDASGKNLRCHRRRLSAIV